MQFFGTLRIYNSWATYKSPPHKQHIWFLPTLKTNAEKPKELFFANARKNVSCERKNRTKINANISEISHTKTP